MSAYDQANMLDDNAAITSSRVSTNVIPLGNLAAGNTEINIGGSENQLYLNLKVKETFVSTGSSTLAVALQTDALAAFGSAAVIPGVGATIAKAALVLGARFRYPLPPAAYEGHIRADYVVAVADFSAGKIDAWIGPDQGRFVSADSGQVNG